jgi:hypothetical protein
MDAKKKLILLTIAVVFCICCCCKTEILADTKANSQQKSVKPSPGYSRSARFSTALRNKAVYKQLQQTVDLSALTLHTTFSEAIEIVSNSTEPSLKIVVFWRDLSDNANIERDTAILIDGVSGIKLHAGLDILLMAVSNEFAKLGYIVKDGIIIIATKDSLPVKMQTRVYDISDLLAMPARFGFVPGFAGGWLTGAYNGQRGRFPEALSNGRVTYNRGNGRRTGRGTTAVWGPQRADRGESRLAHLIRETVRPNRWR